MVKESRCGVYKSVLIRNIINTTLEQFLGYINELQSKPG